MGAERPERGPHVAVGEAVRCPGCIARAGTRSDLTVSAAPAALHTCRGARDGARFGGEQVREESPRGSAQ